MYADDVLYVCVYNATHHFFSLKSIKKSNPEGLFSFCSSPFGGDYFAVTNFRMTRVEACGRVCLCGVAYTSACRFSENAPLLQQKPVIRFAKWLFSAGQAMY